MHPLLRLPYAALGAAAEAAAGLAANPAHDAPKWRRALGARHDVFERFRTFAETRDTAHPLVWFHATSAGEALHAMPVNDRIRRPREGSSAPATALTFFSPSAEGVARRFQADFRDYLPFDTARAARIALDSLAPSALVYSRLDVWPVLTDRAKKRDVPVGMISATVRATSSRRGYFARAFLRDAYASLDLVGAIAGGDAERLVELGVHRDRIRVTGDTSYDQVAERASKVDRNSALLAPLRSDRPTVVAGSTWDADLTQLFAAWPGVRRKFPDARLIIAPHEPTEAHLQPIERWAAGQRLTVARLGAAGAADASVIVVDRVGVLFDLYTLGWVAFVGGGFHDAGLHSVLEPASLGLPVIAGPRGAQSGDLDRLVAAGGGQRVSGSDELASTAVEWIEDHASGGSRGRAAAGVVEANRGAADRTAELVRVLWSTERKSQD